MRLTKDYIINHIRRTKYPLWSLYVIQNYKKIPIIYYVGDDFSDDDTIEAKIEKSIKKPRSTVSEYAPQAYTMKINPDKVREVIGKGGAVIQALTRETNTTIDLEDDGTVKILAVDKADAEEAIRRIKDIVAEPEVGQIYKGTITGIKDFGLFVKILNGFEAMVHISEITGERLAKIEDAKLHEGDTVYIKYMGIDKRGKTRMTMVGIDQKTGEEIVKE